MAEEQDTNRVDVTAQLTGVPSFSIDGPVGATWVGGSYRVLLGEAIFNPAGGSTTPGFRSTVNLVMPVESVRYLIQFLQELPGVRDA